MIIGERSYISKPIHNPFSVEIIIGKYTSIAEGVSIIASDHPMSQVSTFPFHEIYGLEYEPCTEREPVTIGHDVWVGMNVAIRAGVTIGNGAVIAAQSVVVRNILPYEIVAGNPAKMKKFRFDDHIINKLQKIAWWDWEFERLAGAITDFRDTKMFVEKYA